MVTNTEIDISIVPQSNEFMLMQDSALKNNFQLELLSAALSIKTLDLMDGLSLELNNKLSNGPARYSVRKTNLKSMFISQVAVTSFSPLTSLIRGGQIL